MQETHGRAGPQSGPGRRRSRTSWAWPPSAMESNRRPGSSATASGATSRYTRAGRDRLRDRPRADRPRPRSRATASRCCARRASSGPTRTSRSRPPAASSSRSTRPTPPRSARGWRATPSRASSSARTPSRWRRSSPSATSCPSSRRSSRSSPGSRARSRSTSCASAAARATPARSPRASPRSSPRTRTRSSTRRARPARPRAACSRHGNYRQVTRMCEEIDVIEAGELVYLYLPLAHSYALLIQLLCVDLGAPLDLLERRPAADRPDLMATKPAYLPRVPRIFEKIYTLVTSNNDPAEDRRRHAARPEGPAHAGGRPGRSRRRSQAAFEQGRRRALRQRPQHLRRQPQAGDLRRRADRARRSSSSSTPAARPCSRATG